MGNWCFNPYKWSYTPTFKTRLGAHLVGGIVIPYMK